jgi:hypothetical protein
MVLFIIFTKFKRIMWENESDRILKKKKKKSNDFLSIILDGMIISP